MDALLRDHEHQALVRRPLERCARLGKQPFIQGTVWIHGEGQVVLGDRVHLDGTVAPVELHALRGAAIRLGDDCVLESGTAIEATQSVSIGARCRLGRFSAVMDNHFHPLDGNRSKRPDAAPVLVEDDVRFGEHTIVLPGARVRSGANIPPRSVVRRGNASEAPSPHPSGASATGAVRRRFEEHFRQLSSVARARLLFRACARGDRVHAYGFVEVVADGAISIGTRSQFHQGVVPSRLAAHRGAELILGPECDLAHGVTVEAFHGVRLGARCMLASLVRLVDQAEGRSGPIVLEDEVWLARGVEVLPGVRIGSGSVVSAGSIVARDIPPASLAAGRPARSVPLELTRALGSTGDKTG